MLHELKSENCSKLLFDWLKSLLFMYIFVYKQTKQLKSSGYENLLNIFNLKPYVSRKIWLNLSTITSCIIYWFLLSSINMYCSRIKYLCYNDFSIYSPASTYLLTRCITVYCEKVRGRLSSGLLPSPRQVKSVRSRHRVPTLHICDKL